LEQKMRRYFFDVQTPGGLAQDHDGSEYPSDAEAIKEAVYSARELASERVLLGDNLAGWAIVVRVDGEQTVRTLPLAEIVLNRNV
jgi:hypothetical protein